MTAESFQYSLEYFLKLLCDENESVAMFEPSSCEMKNHKARSLTQHAGVSLFTGINL